MREIQLTQGYVALVDDEDYERVNALKWTATVREQDKVYAVRNTGKCVYMHCFILGVKGVDHRDNDGLNNQRNNLRKATQSQNMANAPKQKNAKASSVFKGVRWNKQRNRWVAQICVNYKLLHIGSFRDEVDAAQAYNFVALEKFGEFAKFNTPEMAR